MVEKPLKQAVFLFQIKLLKSRLSYGATVSYAHMQPERDSSENTSHTGRRRKESQQNALVREKTLDRAAEALARILVTQIDFMYSRKIET